MGEGENKNFTRISNSYRGDLGASSGNHLKRIRKAMALVQSITLYFNISEK